MGESFDCTSIREITILLNGLNRTKMDSIYSLYFDESGNTRCFWIKDGSYNVDPHTHFVLGGIVANNVVSFEYAKNKIGCNSTVKEIKTKNVCRGSFEECLKSKKLENYFDLLIEQKWLVHFSVVELFYYGIVDIVDSIEKGNSDSDNLKNELYRILRLYPNKTIQMMIQYNYPNIDNKDLKGFIEACVDIVDEYMIATGDANELTYRLRMLFLLAKEKDELVFIQDEETGSMIKSFTHFYQRPIYMFKNSTLVFDEETALEGNLQACDLILEGKALHNYQFVNSKNNVMVQLSDVFVGVLARFFRFINANIGAADGLVDSFDNQQSITFNKFSYILSLSETENSAFWDLFLCKDMRIIFVDLVEKHKSIHS